MSFIKDLVKASGNEYAGIVADGVAAGAVSYTHLTLPTILLV